MTNCLYYENIFIIYFFKLPPKSDFTGICLQNTIKNTLFYKHFFLNSLDRSTRQKQLLKAYANHRLQIIARHSLMLWSEQGTVAGSIQPALANVTLL